MVKKSEEAKYPLPMYHPCGVSTEVDGVLCDVTMAYNQEDEAYLLLDGYFYSISDFDKDGDDNG